MNDPWDEFSKLSHEEKRRHFAEVWRLYHIRVQNDVIDLKSRNYKFLTYYPYDPKLSYDAYNPYNVRENFNNIDSIIFFEKEGDMITKLWGMDPFMTQDLKDRARSLNDRIKKINR